MHVWKKSLKIIGHVIKLKRGRKDKKIVPSVTYAVQDLYN